jgi:hypothetical protein
MMSARPSIAEFLQEQKPPSVKEFLAQVDEPPRDVAQSASLESVDVEALPETDWLPAANTPLTFTLGGTHEELEPSDVDTLRNAGHHPDDFVKVRHETGKPLLVHRRRLVDQPPQPNDQAATGVPTSTSLASFAAPPVAFNAPDVPVSPQPDRVPMPESRHTLDAQMQAMLEGRRNAVLVTPGAELPPVPRGYTATQTPEGIFIHDPRRVAASLIHSLVENKRHGELMGHVEPVSDQTTAGVVARDPQTGQELQASYVSPENVPAQAEALQDQFPGAKVEAGGAELESRVLNDRAAALSGDITGGLSQLDEPPAPKTSTPSIKQFLERERVTSQTREDVDFSDMEPVKTSESRYRIPVQLKPGEEKGIEPDELARRAVYSFAAARGVPDDFTSSWIVRQEQAGRLKPVYDLRTKQPTTIERLTEEGLKTGDYNPQSNTLTLQGDALLDDLVRDYEENKSYTQRITDDYRDPNKRAGAVALDVVGPPVAAAAHAVGSVSRPVRALSTGASGVARALDPSGAVRLSEWFAGKRSGSVWEILRGTPGAMYAELATGETREGYENPLTATVDNFGGSTFDSINPNLRPLVREVTNIVGDPLIAFGAIGKAGRVARVGAELGEDARLAELASTIEARVGVRPTLEKIGDSIKVTVAPADGGVPVSWTIPPGGLSSTAALRAEAAGSSSILKRAGHGALDLWNAGREIKTAFDFSAPRNAVVATLANPRHAARNMAAQVNAFASEARANKYLDAIRADELFPVAEESGLKIQDFGGAMGQRNELFRSSIAEAVPGVRASSRAFHTYLNGMKFGIWRDFALSHPHASPEDLKGVASFLNYATGQGSFGRLEGSRVVKGLSEALYAPRLTLSYAQTLAAPATLETAAARKFAAAQIVKAVGTGLALGATAKLTAKKTGIDFEFDPRSTDAFKFKAGDYRVNIFGGYTSLAKYTAQTIMGSRKTSAGNMQSISRAAPLTTFARSRLHPSIGFIIDLKTGKTLDGRELYDAAGKLKKGEALRDGLMPLSPGDIWDAVQADRRAGGSGLKGGLASAPSLFGADVQIRDRSGMDSKPITDKQKHYIYNLADHSRVNEDEVSARMFGGRKVSELNKEEATRLIGELKKETARDR